jgi:hypothetical protein
MQFKLTCGQSRLFPLFDDPVSSQILQRVLYPKSSRYVQLTHFADVYFEGSRAVRLSSDVVTLYTGRTGHLLGVCNVHFVDVTDDSEGEGDR